MLILFGNAADGTLRVLQPTSRSPRWQALNGSIPLSSPTLLNHTVTFTVPEGLGAYRDVRVSVRPVSSTGAYIGPAVVSAAVSFSYSDPEVTFVELRPLDTATLNAASTAGVSVAVGAMALLVHGKNFGPAQGVPADGITRSVLLQAMLTNGASSGNFSSEYATVVTWSHTTITMLSTLRFGNAKVSCEAVVNPMSRVLVRHVFVLSNTPTPSVCRLHRWC